MDLTEITNMLHKTNIEHGFDEVTNIDKKLLLAVGELIEAQNELREGHTPQEVYFNEGSEKPEGFGIECADAVIRILNLMTGQGLDAEALILQKADYNDKRPYKHGKAF